MHTSSTPRFSGFGEHRQPELGALATRGSDPQPQDVAFAIDGDPDGDVDRTVGHLTVADLDEQRIDEDHRVDTVKGPVLPLHHRLDDLVGDATDRLFRHRRAIDLGEVRRDLTRGEPFRCERQHQTVHTGQATLPLPDDLGLERAVAVAGHVDLDRADLGHHRLGPDPVAGVPPVAADRVVGLVTEMIAHLDLERRLDDLLGQAAQQTPRAHQRDPFRPGPVHQLPSELLTRGPVPRLPHPWSYPSGMVASTKPARTVTPFVG